MPCCVGSANNARGSTAKEVYSAAKGWEHSRMPGVLWGIEPVNAPDSLMF